MSYGRNRRGRSGSSDPGCLACAECNCQMICPVCDQACIGGHGEVPEHHWCADDHEWTTG